ncbi:MAG: hypothetical protein KJ725_00930 [Gammaproteobacteria bacterium]|jgi:hypothetical protein|uniref:hypothetical protein n=1 Tax=Methylotuvimicrobium TaxID=2822410 RepID=UPI0003470D6F|nr:hypothetical protein [Methylotuvimicrobium buryatense]MBU2568596.1 hypothetical protein [Gammaproteobacteria bacterium]
MIEIQPIVPTYPVIKPAKVTNDEDRPDKKKQQNEQEKGSESEQQDDTGPAQHIDEVV